ncbi:MAG: HD-GYP domain-containing protein [Rubrobacteraceae bacterium]
MGVGFLRVALTATITAFVVTGGQAWSAGIYLAAVIGTTFGLLLAVGWPQFLRQESLARVILDSLTVSLVFGSTVGEGSLFFPLYLLAALGLIGASRIAKSVVGTSALVGGYLAAVAVSAQGPDEFLSPVTGFQAGIILLFCFGVALGDTRLRYIREDNRRASSTLAEEQEYAGEVSSVVSRMGPVLVGLTPAEILKWTAETVRVSVGASYVHAAILDGYLHQTSASGDRDAYPSWWHPEVQRLVLWSCRMGQVQRNSNAIHGIESFLAVPMVCRDGDALGAIVVGGENPEPGGERSLKLVASTVASALREKSEDFAPHAPSHAPYVADEAREGSVRMELTARTLARAIEVCDPRLGQHSRAVSNMSRRIGREMSLGRDQVEALAVGALLHDVGKLGLPDSILHKPMALSAEEREIVKQHPLMGDQILSSSAELSPARPTVKHHHESFDGSGYPDGLRGEDIPVAARIVLVADAFDSMTRDRPYRQRLPVEEALEEILRCSGAQFDPAVARILQRIMGDPEYRQLSS